MEILAAKICHSLLAPTDGIETQSPNSQQMGRQKRGYPNIWRQMKKNHIPFLILGLREGTHTWNFEFTNSTVDIALIKPYSKWFVSKPHTLARLTFAIFQTDSKKEANSTYHLAAISLVSFKLQARLLETRSSVFIASCAWLIWQRGNEVWGVDKKACQDSVFVASIYSRISIIHLLNYHALSYSSYVFYRNTGYDLLLERWCVSQSWTDPGQPEASPPPILGRRDHFHWISPLCALLYSKCLYIEFMRPWNWFQTFHVNIQEL